jgi:hypothetical protein
LVDHDEVLFVQAPDCGVRRRDLAHRLEAILDFLGGVVVADRLERDPGVVLGLLDRGELAAAALSVLLSRAADGREVGALPCRVERLPVRVGELEVVALSELTTSARWLVSPCSFHFSVIWKRRSGSIFDLNRSIWVAVDSYCPPLALAMSRWRSLDARWKCR